MELEFMIFRKQIKIFRVELNHFKFYCIYFNCHVMASHLHDCYGHQKAIIILYITISNLLDWFSKLLDMC